jgi:PAS domain S-box-containing protein
VENAHSRQERDDLKRGEEQLRTLVDNARDIIFQLSLKEVIEYVSPKVKEIYRYDPEELNVKTSTIAQDDGVWLRLFPMLDAWRWWNPS